MSAYNEEDIIRTIAQVSLSFQIKIDMLQVDDIIAHTPPKELVQVQLVLSQIPTKELYRLQVSVVQEVQ
jgi:hypothetical protein